MTNFTFMNSEVFECTDGKHKGGYFIYFDRYSMRKVENGKINRYPYYQIDEENLKATGYKINNNTFNVQIKIDYKSLSKGRNQNKVNEALVIAHRIIQYEARLDQFSIDLIKGYSYGKKYVFDEVHLSDTHFGGMKRQIATIYIDYKTDKIYVYHERLHEKRNSYGHILRDHLDHEVFGFEYKKEINLEELHLLKNKQFTK